MLFSLNNIINNNSSLKLLICICEDTDEDFKNSLSAINYISCLILNYDSKNRHLFIKNIILYNYQN